MRLLKVLAEIATGEWHPARLPGLRRHAGLARDAARAGTGDVSALEAVTQRHAAVLAALDCSSRPATSPGMTVGQQ